MKRKSVILALVALLLALLGNAASADEGKKSAAGREKIQVVADRLEGNYNSQGAVFMGNVVCKQGDAVLVSDLLRIIYRNSSDAANNSKELEKIEAQGNLRFFYGTKTLTGTSAVFHALEQKIVVTGEPAMWDGRNYVRGSRITFHLATGEGIVEGNGTQRVAAVIYPEKDAGER